MNQLVRMILFSVLGLVLSCADTDDSAIFDGALNLGSARIAIASGNGADYAVALYDITGNYLRTIKNYNASGARPRGISALNNSELVVSLDRVDHLEILNTVNGNEDVIYNSDLNQNLYQNEYHPTHGIFAIDSNFIESFDIDGNQLGDPRIPTTVGGCTLATPRGLAFDADGFLLVTNTGNDDIHRYDVTDPAAPICVVSNSSMGNTNPTGIVSHSNGNIYVVTLGDDSVYEFPNDLTGSGTVVFNNTGVINNPTAILELPNGNLLIASDATNTVVEIQVNGTVVNDPFIQDSFTAYAEDMVLLQDVNP